ncbi:MAG: hypothetical protein LBP92_12830 [Deltaproteobacteria bacterium]|nr:hypothetical protein [Deltaproteobacteria bacterium]
MPRRYLIYYGARLRDVRQFAKAADVEIMVIDADAFKKSENVIDQAQGPPARQLTLPIAGS